MKKVKVNGANLFFTSDLHFCHKGIIDHCYRPYKNVDEMNEDIIRKWNKKIPTKAIVIIVGDVTWRRLPETQGLLDRLNGSKILISGNHDKKDVIKYFENSYDMLNVLVENTDGTESCCHVCHFPISNWHKMEHGSFMIHGHLHSNKENRVTGKNSFDCGVDGNDMTPYSWSEIKEILENAPQRNS